MSLFIDLFRELVQELDFYLEFVYKDKESSFEFDA